MSKMEVYAADILKRGDILNSVKDNVKLQERRYSNSRNINERYDFKYSTVFRSPF